MNLTSLSLIRVTLFCTNKDQMIPTSMKVYWDFVAWAWKGKVSSCLPYTRSCFLSKKHFFCTKQDQVNPISWVLILSLVVYKIICFLNKKQDQVNPISWVLKKSLDVYLAQKVISWARDIFSAQNWILVRLVKTDSSLTTVRFAVTDPTEKKRNSFILHLKQRLAQVISTNHSTSWNT